MILYVTTRFPLSISLERVHNYRKLNVFQEGNHFKLVVVTKGRKIGLKLVVQAQHGFFLLMISLIPLHPLILMLMNYYYIPVQMLSVAMVSSKLWINFSFQRLKVKLRVNALLHLLQEMLVQHKQFVSIVCMCMCMCVRVCDYSYELFHLTIVKAS
jgi:hypothetical protein